MLGGRIQAKSGAALGATALRQVADMHFDQCFLGACAVDPTQDLTVFDYEDAEFKRALVRQSNELIVVLTSDKIPSIARYKVVSCQEISILVAEYGILQDTVAALIAQGVDVRFSTEPA